MKTAFFTRHAKSSWKDMSVSDHDRDLNKRGFRDAPMMAAKFMELETLRPKLISSTAVRAYKTAEYFAEAMGRKTKTIDRKSSLYHGSESDFANTIYEQDDDVDSIMIFAHNPGLTYFASDYANFYIDNVPTTGIFKLESKADSWVSFFDDAKLTSFIYPKMFLQILKTS